METQFVYDEDSGGELRNKLLQLLIEENGRKVGAAEIDRIVIVLRDQSGECRGGIWAEALFDWMYIEIVYVPENSRGQGIGSKLVSKVEEIAKSKCCTGIWLETLQFQAPDFYIKQGYQVFATLDHYPRGYKRYFLSKRF